MSPQSPRNGNGHSVFWTPELTFETAPGQPKRPHYLGPRSRTRAASAPVRMWNAVRNWWLNLVEILLLSLITGSMLVPWPRRNSAGEIIRCSFKRMFDLVAATLGIVLASPILLIVPVLIKLDSPGPVFYRQTRVGLDRRRSARRVLSPNAQADRRQRDRRRMDQSGRLFQVIKFRSMVQNAERNCGPVWASHNDPRITRLGRFLRRSRVDEIPQLFNVLSGQMSLVGPRPERPHFVTKFCDRIDKYQTRHRVKPGITGLAQVEHGYDTDENDVLRKVEYDLHYIERWNPALDLRILLRTVRIVISGRGAQ